MGLRPGNDEQPDGADGGFARSGGAQATQRRAGDQRFPLPAGWHDPVAGRLAAPGLADGGREAVKNRDIWESLAAVAARHQVQWEWVRGHSGHVENERVDALLNRVMDRYAAGGQAREGEGWL